MAREIIQAQPREENSCFPNIEETLTNPTCGAVSLIATIGLTTGIGFSFTALSVKAALALGLIDGACAVNAIHSCLPRTGITGSSRQPLLENDHSRE